MFLPGVVNEPATNKSSLNTNTELITPFVPVTIGPHDGNCAKTLLQKHEVNIKTLKKVVNLLNGMPPVNYTF
jgi:hypothetical protein